MGIHGQGNITPIREKRKDGSIRRRWRVSLMVEGRRTWRIAKSPEEAERIRRQLVDAAQLELDPTRQTVAGFLRSWIASQRDAKHRRIRERTLIGYERIVETRIIPELGHLTLARLSKRRIQAWVDGQDGSAQTVRNAHAVLRKALAGAAWDVIASNPAVGVELPRRKAYEGRPLTADEAHRLLKATEGDRLHPLWRLAIVTGLREGELLGLSRDALEVDDGRGEPALGGRVGARNGRDADAGLGAVRRDPHDERSPGNGPDQTRPDRDHVYATLRVETQLQRIDGEWRLGPTKAARRLTVLALDAKTTEVLRAHLRRMADERKPRWRYFGLMFPTPQGQPYHASTVLAEFHAACDKAGIERRRFHDVRHTNNRLMKDLDIPKDARQDRHGHSTDEMDRRYGGASTARDRAAAEALAEAIG